MKLLVGTIITILAIAVQAEKSRRIVGGNEAYRNQFPYQVGLILEMLQVDNPRLCGGSLISSTRVLTAAHCLISVSTALVVLGAHKLVEYEPAQVKFNVPASEFILYPEYSFGKKLNDIAMIKLPSAVTFNNAINPIEIAEGTSDFVGDTAVVSGWGHFDDKSKPSSELRFSSLNIISNKECFVVFGNYIIDSSICAQSEGKAGLCFGDSGKIQNN